MNFVNYIKQWNLSYMLLLLVFNQLIFITGTDGIQDEIQQLESALKSRNYNEALSKYNSIKTNKEQIKQTINNVYKELNDIDIILYFNSLINDVSERAEMYNTTYEVIIKDGGKDAYINDTDKHRMQGLFLCNTMKFIEKVENNVITVLKSPSDLHTYMLSFIENLKTNMKEKLKLEMDIFSYGILNLTDSEILFRNSFLKHVFFVKNTKIIYKQVELLLKGTNDKDKTKCIFRSTDGEKDLLIYQKLLKPNISDIIIDNNYETKETKELENALNNKDFHLASIKFALIKENALINEVIKKLYRHFYGIEDLVYFGTLISNNYNGNTIILEALINIALGDGKYTECEKLKTINKLETLRSLQPQHPATIQYTDLLKKNLSNEIIKKQYAALSTTLKSPQKINEVYLIKPIQNFEYSIYDIEGVNVLATVKYYLNKTGDNDDETYCYFQGIVSIDDYDKWYTSNYLLIINWFTFIAIVTAYC